MSMHRLNHWRGWAGRRPSRVLFALSIALLLAFGPAAMQSTSLASRVQQSGSTYRNPIIPQNVADPAIIKALDGYYYIVGSSDFWEGGSYHILPIFRSTDLVHWKYVADAFSARPDWAASDAGLWAPDLQYYNHKYYMYFTASWTKPLPRYGTNGGSAIGVATAASPAGPWTDSGDSAGGSYAHGPIVPPRSCAFNTDPNCYYWTFDPAEFTDQNGQKYMYYGSYFGGTLVQKLTPDGLHTSGGAIQIGHWDRYEGTYVIRHDVNGQRYYYNFSSAANCCSGPNTGYSVEVNRATSPTGTFVDQNGFPMLHPGSVPAPTTRPVDDPAGDNIGAQGGGYPTLKQNGNKWHGTGHNALITDLSGHMWIVYHGVDKNNGWVNGAPFPITFRQTMLDRLDWTANGWPVTNGGAGPSEVNTAPVTTPIFGDNFNGPGGCAAPETGPGFPAGWLIVSGSWSEKRDTTCTAGGFAEQTSTSGQALMVSRSTVSPGYRAECDLRLVAGGRYGCVVSYLAKGNQRIDSDWKHTSSRFIAALLDPQRNTLVTGVYSGNHLGDEESTPLPANFDHTDWHHLAIDQDLSRPGRPLLRFTVSDRNRDPLAIQQRSFPADFANHVGSVGFITQNAHADFDNITVARLSPETVPAEQTPTVGSLLRQYSDEFNGSLGHQWSWVREDPSKHSFVGGQLSIIVNGDLYRDANNATNILLESPPAGAYVMETKITFDPRDNYQQAGLIVYSDDDHYIKVGPAHADSLNKMLSGRETLEPTPNLAPCDVQPSPTSNVAIHVYTNLKCPNEGEAWDYLTNPKPTLNGSTATAPRVTDWLRIYRRGNVYTPYTSVDDVHWIKGAAWDLEPASQTYPIKIGLFAFSAGPHNDIPALFDYFHVYSQP